MGIKIWVDDVRPVPCSEYDVHCKTVNEFIELAEYIEAKQKFSIDLIDLDHDAGDYRKYGGDYIAILDWLENWKEEHGLPICETFRIHSYNPVGRENMKRVIEKNGWRLLPL